MSTILSLLTLLYREYFRTKLAEMKALPPIPRKKPLSGTGLAAHSLMGV
jgi:hypothetical protein